MTEAASDRSAVSMPHDLRPKRTLRRAAIAAAVVVAIALALVFGVRHSKAAKRAHSSQPPRDVPTLEGNAVVFSPAFRERAGVKTSAIARQLIVPQVHVVGTVALDPDHVAAVGTRIRGLVTRVDKVEGDRVSAGEALATMESAELGQAQADVLVAQAHRKAAESNASRERDLASRRLSTTREAEVADATLEEHRAMLAAAQQRVSALGGNTRGPFGTFILRAPIGGTVVERHVNAGQSVEGSVIAYKVADLDYLWIELALFERDIGAVRENDAVEIRPLGDTTRVIQGRVAHVGDVIHPESRAADVRVEVDNRSRLLRPGEAVSARIRTSGPAREALAVPQRAITYVDGSPHAFVAQSETRVVPTPVKLGRSDGDMQEVIEGLREGDIIVTDGAFALKSELFR